MKDTEGSRLYISTKSTDKETGGRRKSAGTREHEFQVAPLIQIVYRFAPSDQSTKSQPESQKKWIPILPLWPFV